MKTILLAFPIIALLAAGCNSSQQTSLQIQTPLAQNTNPITTHTPKQTSGWNTYSDKNYGFQIMLPPDYKFMGKTVQDSSGALVLTPENQQFNNAVKSPSGTYLALTVWHFDKVPTRQEIQKACEPGGNGLTPYGGLFCDSSDVSQEGISAFAQTLKNAPVNQSVPLPGFLASGATIGTVINLNGINGLIVTARNTQAIGSTVSLYWFDKSKNLFQIYQELSPSVASEAMQSLEYKTFLTIISTFKFNQ